jgi:hypothetical protein
VKKKYNNIEELITLLRTAKQDIEEKIFALESSPNSFNEQLLRKYIETRSTAKATEYARTNGARSKKGTAFAPSDVSELINNGNENINPALLRLAREIFSVNVRSVSKQYW